MESPFRETIVSLSEARKDFSRLVREVARGDKTVSIAQDSHVHVSLVSRDFLDDLRRRLEAMENLLETYEILQDEDLMHRIRLSEKNLKKEKGYSLSISKKKMGV